MLVDSIVVKLSAGRGGDGIVSWRHEKYVPRGGPDGGDGGKGGDIILLANHNLDTLATFRYRKVFKAEDGERGRNKKQTGLGGEDLLLLVPVGTVVVDLTTGQTILDLTADEQRTVVARGGRGGKGNIHFTSSTNQSPTEFTAGQSGQTCEVKLELRLVADLALVGLPNAGKSSLLMSLTGAEARIGDYPFSTTEPLLGVLKRGSARLTLLDLPGFIAGAHEGKGLGTQFLRHLSRVKGLLHIVDATQADPEAAIRTIQEEIRQYDAALVGKAQQLVFNKTDLLTEAEKASLQKKYPQALLVSAASQENLTNLSKKAVRLLLDERKK